MPNTISSPYLVNDSNHPPRLKKPSTTSSTGTYIHQTKDAFATVLFSSKEMIHFLFLFSLVWVLAGSYSLLAIAPKFHALRITYDNGGTTTVDQRSMHDQPVELNTTKTIRFQIDQDMQVPLYIHYELTNFYQNLRLMQPSRYDHQLAGHDPTKLDQTIEDSTTLMDDQKISPFSSCAPMVLHGDYRRTGAATDPPICTWNSTNAQGIPCKVMWPCGLLTSSFFNDVYTFKATNNSTLGAGGWRETGLAWSSDQQEERFKNPTVDTAGFNYIDDVNKGTSSKYFHLCQMFPKFPHLKNQGVTNEHFKIWMRTTSPGGSHSSIRKLYAIIDYVDKIDGVESHVLKKGDTFDVQVRSEFDSRRFGGTKSLVLSTRLDYRNAIHYGWLFIGMGSVTCVIGLAFLIAGQLVPRSIVDIDGNRIVVPKME